MKRTSRIVVATVVAVVAVLAFFAAQPSPDTSPTAISLARSFDFDTAESAPQQTVVNGWQSNDLLRYIAEQQDAYESQQSMLLLVIALATASLVALSAGTRRTAETESSVRTPLVHTPREPENPTKPAAWYLDPRDEARLRYWDGKAWTERTAP